MLIINNCNLFWMITLQPGDIDVGGVTLRNHLLLAAGVLGTTGASLQRLLKQGAGGVVTKSIGPEPNAGHHGPCLIRTECGVLNAMGLPNPSKNFVEELAPLKGEPVIVSIFGKDPEEFKEVAGWFAEHAKAFELNVSCPHAAGYGAAIGTDPETVLECTRAVASYGVPVWVKLTPNVTDITTIGLAAEKGGASAIVAINTVRGMRISTAMRRPVLGNRAGGLSGKAIFPIAVKCVWDLYAACTIPVIGCGGVSTAEDVIEMMMAGAQAVEIGTAVMDDVRVFDGIAQKLYAKDGADPASIVGVAHD